MDTIINKEEVWRPVVGYSLLYEVSNRERIRSLDKFIKSRYGVKNHFVKGRILKQDKTYLGYGRVTLYKDEKPERISVHRIVAQAFPEICGEWFEGYEVHHKDFNPSNNVPENLIVLSKEAHILLHLESEFSKTKREEQYKKMVNRPDLSKPIIQLTKTGDFVKRWNSIKEAERSGIASKQNIMRVLKKKGGSITAAGFRWIYESEYI